MADLRIEDDCFERLRTDLIVNVHQPDFLPWIGFWSKLWRSDKWVVLNSVALNRRNFTRRVKLGDSSNLWWATCPVDNNIYIKDVQLGHDYKTVLRKLVKRIQQEYSKAPYKDRLDPVLSYLENQENTYFWELSLRLVEIIWPILMPYPMKPFVVHDGVNHLAGGPLMFHLTRCYGGDTYLAGPGWSDYMKLEDTPDDMHIAVHHNGPGYSGSILHTIAHKAMPSLEVVTFGRLTYPWPLAARGLNANQ